MAEKVQAAAAAATQAILKKSEKRLARSRSKSAGPPPQQQQQQAPPPPPPLPPPVQREKSSSPEITRQVFRKSPGRSVGRESGGVGMKSNTGSTPGKQQQQGNRIVILTKKKDVSRSRSRSRSPYSRSRSRSPYRSRSRSRSPYYGSRGGGGGGRPVFPPREQHFCNDCKLPFNDDNAYEHFTGRTHRERTKYKIRCYLCSLYVQNPKDHLEEAHAKEVFQCKGLGCSQPKFLDLIKILNHIWDKHPQVCWREISCRVVPSLVLSLPEQEAGPNCNADDLIRRGMISVPINLSSYKCKLCNRQFVGQSLTAVLQHQRWEDNIRLERKRSLTGTVLNLVEVRLHVVVHCKRSILDALLDALFCL